MRSRSIRTIGLAACSLLTLFAATALAARPSENLFPKTTKGYLSVLNVEELRESWNKTQLGQLMADPVMKPFADDFREQLQHKWNQTHRKLALTWSDMEGVPSGEVAIAMIQPTADSAAMALVAEIKGHEDRAGALVNNIARNLADQQATRSQRVMAGVKVTVFDLPAKEEIPAAQVLFATKDDMLLVSDNATVIEGMLQRMDSGSGENLASLKAFDAVMKRCQTAAGEMAPQIRWFVEPFGYAEAVRSTIPKSQQRRGKDWVKLLKNEGFTAIQGLGGFLHLAAGKYELLHRTAVYAPAVKAGPEKYEMAARMLDFPNGGSFEPPTWVPREVATYAAFNLNIQNAFEASKSLVDRVVGDPVFEDVLDSLKNDPNGPKVDVRRELVANFGTRALVISDYELPITPKSERMLVAIETVNPSSMTATVEKWMKSDPTARRREYKGHVIWDIVDENPTELTSVQIENAPAIGIDDKDDDAEEESEHKMLPNSAISVAHGNLLVATHYDFLVKVLDQMEVPEKLSASPDFRIVQTELAALAAPENCAGTFSRTDEEYRAVYELIRQGRMPEAETMLGKLLNHVLGDGKEHSRRQQKIDGSKLPEFEAIRRYFGPAGITITSEQDGWYVTGVMLKRG